MKTKQVIRNRVRGIALSRMAPAVRLQGAVATGAITGDLL